MAMAPVLVSGATQCSPLPWGESRREWLDSNTMSDTDDDADETGEYRPTDWLAVSGFSYGVAGGKAAALANCLRYAGPWDEDRAEPVEVALWEMYADSWQTHSPRGPERSGEQLSFRVLEIPAVEANEVHDKATIAQRAIDRALDAAEATHSTIGPEGTD